MFGKLFRQGVHNKAIQPVLLEGLESRTLCSVAPFALGGPAALGNDSDRASEHVSPSRRASAAVSSYSGTIAFGDGTVMAIRVQFSRITRYSVSGTVTFALTRRLKATAAFSSGAKYGTFATEAFGADGSDVILSATFARNMLIGGCSDALLFGNEYMGGSFVLPRAR